MFTEILNWNWFEQQQHQQTLLWKFTDTD